MTRSRFPSVGALRTVDRRALVELTLLLAVVVALQAYVNLLDAVIGPLKDVVDASTGVDRHLAGTAARGLFVTVGLGAVAAAYASARDLTLPLSVPDRDTAGLVALAAASAVVFATLPLLPLALRYGVEVSHLAQAVANAPANLVDRTLVSVAAFTLGMAVLYHGLVQGALGRLFDRETGLADAAGDRLPVAGSRERAALATALLAAYFATPRYTSPPVHVTDGPWLFLTPGRALVAGLALLALGVAVYAAERVDDRRVRAAAVLPLLVALTLAVFSLGQGVESPPEWLSIATRVGLVGVAAYAYVGARTLFAPAFTYATYAVAHVIVQSAVLYMFVA